MFKSDPLLSYEESLHHPYPQQQEQQHTAPPQEGNYSPVRHGGITEPSDPDEFCKNKSVRYEFMGKVFLILSAQMLFMMSIVAVFTFIDPVRLAVREGAGWYFLMSISLFFLIYILMLDFHKAGRQLPWNLVLLFKFTLLMSVVAGVTSNCLDTMAVFFVLGIIAVECFITAIIFRVRSQVDFTFCSIVLYALGVVLLITGFTTVVALSIPYIQWIDVILTVYGVMFYFMFLAGSTSVLQDIASVSLRPNEYVFGALAIYIVYPLLSLNDTNEPQAILSIIILILVIFLIMFKSDPLLSYEESLHHPYPQQQQNTAPPQEGNYSPVRHGGITEPSDPDEFCKNKSVRSKFMGKVFLILFAQMIFMMSIVAVFTFIDPVRLFVSQYPGLFFCPSLLFFLTTYFLILSCHKARRHFPWNLVLLFTFTLAMSFLAGVTSSCLDTKAVFFLVGIMAYECFTIVANFRYHQAKVTDCAFMLYSSAIMLPLSGFLVVFLMYARFIRWIDVILTVYGLSFYNFLLAGNTRLLQDLAAVSLRPNEYVFGALAIYIVYSCCP